MGLRDVLREHVWKRFVDKCWFRMRYGGYKDYLTSKGFGTRLLSLIVTAVILYVLLGARYGFRSGFVNDLAMVFLSMIIVYAVVSLVRYEVEESEAREKLEKLCSDMGSYASSIAVEILENTVIRGLLDALDEDYDRVSALARRKKEIEHMLRSARDKRNREQLIRYLRKVDGELTQAINEVLRGKRLDTHIVKKLLEEITG